MKKREGFKSEKLFVLPEYVRQDIFGHELLHSFHITDIGCFPHAKYHYRERASGCDSHIFIYCSDGEGWIGLGGGRSVRIQKQSLFVIPAGTSHRYGASETNPWSIYWFHLQGKDVSAFLDSFGLNQGPQHLSVGTSRKLIEMFQHCYDLLSLKTYSVVHHIQAAQAMRYLLSTIGLDVNPDEKIFYIEQAMAFMADHLEKSLKLPDVAKATGLSRQHLTYLFKKSTGYPPINYFLRMKMQKAGQMLDLTDLTVKEISHALGIDDPYYFSRLFKKIMGTSPATHRKIQKG